MEFLVRVAVRLPTDLPEEQVRRLRAAELEAGRTLAARGVIQRIWRVPGTTCNVAIWSVADADELHRLISGLPLFPWLEVDVQALGRHPVEHTDDG